MKRTHDKRRRDREASRQTLLNRCKRITHILAGLPTGEDAWTVDQHRASEIATPVPFEPIEVEWIRKRVAGFCGPMPPEVEQARRRRTEKTPRGRSGKASNTLIHSLPASYGVDPLNRITHQQIAEQAAKAVSALDSCGHWRAVYACPDHGKWATTSRCGHRLCVPCAVHRRSELLSRYRQWLTTDHRSGEPRVPMLTLTQRSKDGEWLSDAFDRLTKRHRAFTLAVSRELTGSDCPSKEAVKHAKKARENIGGLTSLEATPRPGRRWNAHAHILLREPDYVPDEWTVPHWHKRPLNPWRFRLLWASALLDGRKSTDAAKMRRLTRLYVRGRDAWRDKMEADGDKKAERRAETLLLKKWAALCDCLDVPAICDLRWVHPAEGIKYVSKGFDVEGSWVGYTDKNGKKRWRRGPPLTDWHLWQLLLGTYYLRRTIPWGSLYRLPKSEDGQAEEPEDDHRNCPYCGKKSAPVAREKWSGAVADTVLVAAKLDRRPFRPRGPPGEALPQPPGPQLAAPIDPADRALLDVLGLLPAQQDAA